MVAPSARNGAFADVLCGTPHGMSITCPRPVRGRSLTARVASLLGWLLPLSMPMAAPEAQGGRGSDPDAACPSCEIALTRLATLGSIEEPGGVMQGDLVAADGGGRFYAVASAVHSEITIFDRGGSYLRTVGRKGGGPGEFRGIAAIWTRGDSVHVLDSGNLRYTVLGPGFDIARSGRIPAATSEVRALPLDDGTVLVNARIQTAGQIGLPLHLLSPDGQVVRSFGATDEKVLPGRSRATGRVLADASAGSVWAGHTGTYTLELWSLDGRHLRTLVRRPAWFPERAEGAEYNPADPPRSFLQAVRLNPDGTLLTVSIVADPEWTEGAIVTRRNGTGPIVSWRPDRADRLFDSMIEVIDTHSNTLLKSVRFDGYISQLLPGGLAVVPRADDDGVEYLDILKLDWLPTPSDGGH